MSQLAPLLQLQALDLAADAARTRSAELPEREARVLLEKRVDSLDEQLTAARASRAGLEAEEERLGGEVGRLAGEIEAAELRRYSGGRVERDEAASHETSQQALREAQGSLEEQEMALLEQIEEIETRIDELETERRARQAEIVEAGRTVEQVEKEVEAELARLSRAREDVTPSIPAAVLQTYERIRAQPRKRGRGVATFSGGICRGCHTQVPAVDKSRILAQPEDALVQCPRCQRVLVRETPPGQGSGP